VPPDLLILDEPWSGLDAAAHGVLGGILDEIVQAGGTVVFTDHREAISRSHSTISYGVEAGRVAPIEQSARRERVSTSHVLLTDPAGGDRPRPIDWHTLAGVLGVTPTAEFISIEVGSDTCDALLTAALRGGWSVAEVRRAESGKKDAWGH
jgi:energy-coupling factor transporter ATP-binding protein EcfA2